VAGAFQNDDDMIAGINVTPLVDVVLVLLIIFLITAPVMYQSAIKVQLPTAKSGEESAPKAIKFTLTKEGQLSWDDQVLTWEQLGPRLAQFQKAPDQSVLISADEGTSHGTVVKLMDMLRQAGLTRFGLNVQSTPR